MPVTGYVLAGVALAVLITVSLRTAPFLLRRRLEDSPALEELGRVMPFGAVALLAVYCVAGIYVTGPSHGAPELLAVVATIALHAWRHNAILSIAGGTLTCVALALAL